MECVVFASMFTGGNFECSILCQPSNSCSSSHRKFVSLYLLNYTYAIHTCTCRCVWGVGICVGLWMWGVVVVCVGVGEGV